LRAGGLEKTPSSSYHHDPREMAKRRKWENRPQGCPCSTGLPDHPDHSPVVLILHRPVGSTQIRTSGSSPGGRGACHHGHRSGQEDHPILQHFSALHLLNGRAEVKTGTFSGRIFLLKVHSLFSLMDTSAPSALLSEREA